jgi:hypothetical protein
MLRSRENVASAGNRTSSSQPVAIPAPDRAVMAYETSFQITTMVHLFVTFFNYIVTYKW